MKNSNDFTSELADAQLDFIHSHRTAFKGINGTYQVLGLLNMDLSQLRVTIHLELTPHRRKYRNKLDLYDVNQVQKMLCNLVEKQGLNYQAVEADIVKLTELLEAHRESIFEQEYGQKKKIPITLTTSKEKEAVGFLESEHLIKNIDQLLQT